MKCNGRLPALTSDLVASCVASSSMTPHLSCHDAAPSARSAAFAVHPATPSAESTSTASSTVEPTVIPCGAAEEEEEEEDDVAALELALPFADAFVFTTTLLAPPAAAASEPPREADAVFVAAVATCGARSAEAAEEVGTPEALALAGGAAIAATRSPQRCCDASASLFALRGSADAASLVRSKMQRGSESNCEQDSHEM